MKELTSELITAWGLSSLIYTKRSAEDTTFVNYARSLFGLKVYEKFDSTGSLLYACAMDEKTGELHIINRGTSGFTWWGNLMSWCRNANIPTGFDGIHNGFGGASEKIIESFKHQIMDADTIRIQGQSQGAGLTIAESFHIADKFKNVKKIIANAFACPPVFDKKGAAAMLPYIESGRAELTRWNGHGDPIDSEVLRNEKSIFLDGVDVGKEITLYQVIRFESTPSLHVIQHSNAVTNASLMQMFSESAEWFISKEMFDEANKVFECIVMLGKIGRRIIN